MTLPGSVLSILYGFLLLVLFSLALQRAWLAYRFTRLAKSPKAKFQPFEGSQNLPCVTVQLPIFNEPLVARRLLQQIGRLDYPRDLLQIQVLDDSTDETQQIAQAGVMQLRQAGIDADYLHRDNRTHFKAGALQAGMKSAKGEIFVYFDADFMPSPDFLKETVPAFLEDERLGMLQTRWTHLNRTSSVLTRTQSVLLDAHFLIEHGLSNKNREFFQFNGSAGLWRKRCIEDAGGWQGDSLTEDLDLSMRAYLKGWNFLFLPQVEVPAEIPVCLQQLQTQQDRWAQGTLQTAAKLLPMLRHSPLTRAKKWKAFFRLTLKAFNPLLLCLALIMPVSLYDRSLRDLQSTFWIDLGVVLAASLALVAYYGAPQRELYRDWKGRWLDIPLSVILGLGMSLGMTKSLLRACLCRPKNFHRTMKLGLTDRTEKIPSSSPPSELGLSYMELAMGLYLAVWSVYFLWQGAWPALYGLGLLASGYSFVGLLSLAPKLRKLLAAKWRPEGGAPEESILPQGAVYDYTP